MHVNSPVLIVDDDMHIRRMIKRILELNATSVIEASDGVEALKILEKNSDIHVAISDLHMPGMGGLNMIEKAINTISRPLSFIVLTGNGDKTSAVSALRLGVQEFLDKPVEIEKLCFAVSSAIQSVQKKINERIELKTQADQIEMMSSELANMQEKVNQSGHMTALQIAQIASYRDVETAEHCRRVGKYARKLAELSGQNSDYCNDIELAAILHDVGKIAVPDHILYKPGKLSDAEYALMSKHTLIGSEMLAHKSYPVISMSQEIALSHHERWDGTGYPHQLYRQSIPLSARIVAICDVYDALRAKRAYKPAFTREFAINILKNGDERTSPDHFDPHLLQIFCDNHLCFDEIFNNNPDSQ